MSDPYNTDRPRNPANYQPLTPLTFLERAASVTFAKKIASKSSLTVATGKRAFYQQKEMDLTAAYEYASAVMVENMLARDAEEGIGAFFEKRAPDWHDE